MRSPPVKKSTPGRFPTTHYSAIFATRSKNEVERTRAYETILASYWKPAYKYIRIKWQSSNEDTEDLVQEFFAKSFEKNYFQSYDSAKGSFHGFLRICLDRFVLNERKATRCRKRASGWPHFTLDFETAEIELRKYEAANHVSPEEYFHREWVRSMFSVVIESVREKCVADGKLVGFQLFELYDLEDTGRELSYRSLAERFGIKVSDVTNHLAYVRREFRRVVVEKLREITATDEEFRREARALLGVELS